MPLELSPQEARMPGAMGWPTFTLLHLSILMPATLMQAGLTLLHLSILMPATLMQAGSKQNFCLARCMVLS